MHTKLKILYELFNSNYRNNWKLYDGKFSTFIIEDMNKVQVFETIIVNDKVRIINLHE